MRICNIPCGAASELVAAWKTAEFKICAGLPPTTPHPKRRDMHQQKKGDGTHVFSSFSTIFMQALAAAAASDTDTLAEICAGTKTQRGRQRCDIARPVRPCPRPACPPRAAQTPVPPETHLLVADQLDIAVFIVVDGNLEHAVELTGLVIKGPLGSPPPIPEVTGLELVVLDARGHHISCAVHLRAAGTGCKQR